MLVVKWDYPYMPQGVEKYKVAWVHVISAFIWLPSAGVEGILVFVWACSWAFF